MICDNAFKLTIKLIQNIDKLAILNVSFITKCFHHWRIANQFVIEKLLQQYCIHLREQQDKQEINIVLCKTPIKIKSLLVHEPRKTI